MRNPLYPMNQYLKGLVLFGLVPVAQMATAVHLDVAVSVENGRMATDFCLEGGEACTRLPVLEALGIPPFVAPLDLETGKQIFVSDFSDFEGGLFSTDDPGFISGAGRLPGQHTVEYRGVGKLQFWDAATETWSETAPAGLEVRLFGGLSEQSFVINDPSQCGGLPFCPVERTEFVASQTSWSGSGVTGDIQLVVGQTNAAGELHVHMDWFLENAGAETPPEGAYMVELEILSSTLASSEPFMLMFANGLDTEAFGRALSAKIIAPVDGGPQRDVPVPFAAALLMPLLGLLGIGGGLRSRRANNIVRY